jgi:hypothetical protein
MKQKLAFWSCVGTLIGGIAAVVALLNPPQATPQTPAASNQYSQGGVEQRSQGTFSMPVNVGSGGTMTITNQLPAAAPQAATPQPAAPLPAALEPARAAGDSEQRDSRHPEAKTDSEQSEIYINKGTRSPQIIKPSGPVNINYGASGARYPEPSEAQMKEAVLGAMEAAGGLQNTPGVISKENALAGASVELAKFKKIECVPAQQRAGYWCDYEVTTGFRLYSKEGSAAADAQANAINTLLGYMNAASSRSRVHARFVRSGREWLSVGND